MGYDSERTPATGTHGLLRACAQAMGEIDVRLHGALAEFRSLSRQVDSLRWVLIMLVLLLTVHVAIELAYVLNHAP